MLEGRGKLRTVKGGNGSRNSHVTGNGWQPGLGRREVVSPAQYFGGRANEVELDARNAGTRRSRRASNMGGEGTATGRADVGRADLTSI